MSLPYILIISNVITSSFLSDAIYDVIEQGSDAPGADVFRLVFLLAIQIAIFIYFLRIVRTPGLVNTILVLYLLMSLTIPAWRAISDSMDSLVATILHWIIVSLIVLIVVGHMYIQSSGNSVSDASKRGSVSYSKPKAI